MKTLMRAFENLFTNAKSTEEKELTKMYRAWTVEREKAAKYGPHHVAEIDAIFSRAGL
jgi:predicted P-loop ATPase